MAKRIKKPGISYEEAERLLQTGRIDGFVWGAVVVAKKPTMMIYGRVARSVPRGKVLITRTASQAYYGVPIGPREWTVRKKDFAVVGRVVHEVWKV